MLRRLRPLTEAECYARCYGSSDDTVTIVRPERSRRPRTTGWLSGEDLRRLFEERLEERLDAEAA